MVKMCCVFCHSPGWNIATALWTPTACQPTKVSYSNGGIVKNIQHVEQVLCHPMQDQYYTRHIWLSISKLPTNWSRICTMNVPPTLYSDVGQGAPDWVFWKFNGASLFVQATKSAYNSMMDMPGVGKRICDPASHLNFWNHLHNLL